jgi:hypothetical protein
VTIAEDANARCNDVTIADTRAHADRDEWIGLHAAPPLL